MISFQQFLNIIILVGVIQGFITAILLYRLKSNNTANKILSCIILLISLACLNIYLLEAVQISSTLWSILGAIVPLIIIMPIGPLIYFYVKAILYPEFKITKRDRPHFYSIIIDLIPYLAALTLISGVFFGFINPKNAGKFGQFVDAYHMYADIPRWVSLLIYIGVTHKLIHGYSINNKKKTIINWTKRFTVGFSVFLAIWFVHLIPYIIPSLTKKLLSSVGWYPIYIPLIILIYWLGINGYIISFKTYKKSSQKLHLSNTIITDTLLNLEKAMKEDLLFLNPMLKLDDIVKHTQIPQKTISFVLNQHLGKSFNEFVNSYRVEEFKSRLLKDNSENLTITGIAFECGFNSQATFQRTFKAFTNVSPKEFQQQHTKS